MRSCGDGLVGKVPAIKAWGPRFGSPALKTVSFLFVIPVLDEWRQVDPWSSTAGQSSRLSELCEWLVSKIDGEWSRAIVDSNLWPLHVLVYFVYTCVHTHEHMYISHVRTRKNDAMIPVHIQLLFDIIWLNILISKSSVLLIVCFCNSHVSSAFFGGGYVFSFYLFMCVFVFLVCLKQSVYLRLASNSWSSTLSLLGFCTCLKI